MKKLCSLFAIAILVSGFAFAQENESSGEGASVGSIGTGTSSNETASDKPEGTIERFNAEINIGFPIHWTNGFHDAGTPLDYSEDKTVTANTSIGVGITFNFTNIFGFILDADFFSGSKLYGVSESRSDSVSLSGANIFLGPLFYLYNNNVFRIPLAVGFHFYYFSDDLWVPPIDGDTGKWINRQDYQFGMGLSLGFQLHFDTGIYVFSRTSALFDFIRVHSTTGSSGLGSYCLDLFDGISWNVKPTIGIGVRF